MEVPDDDETWCRSCASHVSVRDGEEYTGYCDHCAQNAVVVMGRALADILEYAKAMRDLSDHGTVAQKSFSKIVNQAYTALGEPSAADIDFFRR